MAMWLYGEAAVVSINVEGLSRPMLTAVQIPLDLSAHPVCDVLDYGKRILYVELSKTPKRRR